MRIDEFTHKDSNELPFDIAEDVAVFMRNDPIFYRQKYYPAVCELKREYDQKKNADGEKHFGRIVDSAMNTYCKKFNVSRQMSDIFTAEDRQNIISKITEEEIENIRKGEY
jgi:spore coat polysaccharide biosynthesis protein SpsF (cytidylyltransferase family)